MEISSWRPPEREPFSHHLYPQQWQWTLTPPHSPNPNPNPHPISRSHDYPTTFVQADTATFKQIFQMLTGSSDKTDPFATRGGGSDCGGIPPIDSTGQKKHGFKLYERRNSLKNGVIVMEKIKL